MITQVAQNNLKPSVKEQGCSGDANCAVAKTLKIIGSKWTMMILHNMFEGKKRFGELQRSMEGISPKTLSQRLQELEQDGIITKKVFAEVPLHVEYNLTEKGISLKKIFKDLAEWGRRVD
jgi:DNA-binding HxlR family transcriptional regulator